MIFGSICKAVYIWLNREVKLDLFVVRKLDVLFLSGVNVGVL